MEKFRLLTIHLWTTKNFFLYARLTPHAKKLLGHFLNYNRRYFHRLLKELTLFLPLIIFTVAFSNLFIPKTTFEKSKELILLSPTNPAPHILLASELVNSKQFPPAQNELQISYSLTRDLHTKTKIKHQLSKIELLQSQPEKVKQEILFWQKISEDYPYYRDAYIKLSILHWKLYQSFNSKKNLDEALSLDPNNKKLELLKTYLTE